MRSEAELKTLLQAIIANESQPPSGVDPFDLAVEMTTHLGSTDADLRDGLIYTLLVRWIMRHKRFDGEQLRRLLAIVSDDQHLFYQIGEANTDSVFRRSFSVLLWPPILIAERETPFLSAGEVGELTARLARYLREEQDHRGFVAGKGWAHAAAHSADALDDLVQCGPMDAAGLHELLDAAGAAIAFGPMPHLYEEDERQTTAVLAAMRSGMLSEAQHAAWLAGLAAKAAQPAAAGSSFVHFNVKAFLRSLFFRAGRSEDTASLLSPIEAALAEIDHFK